MQGSVVREFLNNDCAEALVFQQGDASREAYDWAVLFWQNNFLRHAVIWDDDGQLGSGTFGQPQIGIPFGRHFIIDGAGNVADAYFGHDPNRTIETMYALYGGDCDGDGLHDAWEREHFDDLAQDAANDPDLDGATNLEEFGRGTDPRLAGCDVPVTLYLSREGAIGARVSFGTLPLEWWRAGVTRLHSIEGTDSARAGGWAPEPGLSRLTGPGQVDESLPPSGPLRFYRLRSWLE